MARRTKRQSKGGHKLGKRGAIKTFLPTARKMTNKRAGSGMRGL